MTFSSKHRPPGFTLVEVLVAIAVVAVLLSLTLPALRSARQQSSQLECLGSLSSIMQGHALVSGQARDTWANLFGPNDQSMTVETNDTSIGIDYYGQTRIWVGPFIGILWERGQGGRSLSCPAVYRRSPESANPDRPRLYDSVPYVGAFNSYYYSAAFMSDPTLWDPNDASSRESPELFRRVVGVHEVTFPAQKVVMSEAADHHGDQATAWSANVKRLNVGFADAHCASLPKASAAPSLHWRQPIAWFPPDSTVPFSSPADGFRGRDVR